MTPWETWYVLEDGTAVSPAEVTSDAKGALHHKKGPVAMRSHDTPSTRSVGVDESGKQWATDNGDHDQNGTARGAVPPAAPAPVLPPTAAARPVAAKHKKTADMKPAKPKKAGRKPGYQTR